jgi:hypothetical protein
MRCDLETFRHRVDQQLPIVWWFIRISYELSNDGHTPNRTHRVLPDAPHNRGATIPTRHLEALPGLRIGRDGLMRRVSEPLGFGVLAALILQAHSSVICAERYWFAADSGIIPGVFKAKVMFWSISPEPDRSGSSSPTATKPRDAYR